MNREDKNLNILKLHDPPEGAYRIIYNSDLIIRDPRELSTLCVFYDRTYLPFTTPETSTKYSGHRFISVDLPTGVVPAFEKAYVYDVEYWRQNYITLFEERVIERLPAPPWGQNLPFKIWKDRKPEILDLITKSPTRVEFTISDEPMGEETPEENLEKGIIQETLIKRDIILHFARTDLQLPQLFITDAARPSREFLVGLEAKEAFKYILPVLGILHPEEILKVRNKVKDTREGFSLHLQKLSKGIEERLKGGESLQEMEKYTKAVIETELIPDYREFRRQLEAERIGIGKRILDSVGCVFEIDVAPWTPKFWGELVKAFGIAFPSSEQRKAKLTNESQAFQFMRIVEKVGND